MADLDYDIIQMGIWPAKMYRVQDCERRAWQIYGGPEGLEAEREIRIT